MTAQLESDQPTQPRARSGKFRAVLALGAVLGVGTAVTLAAWSDSGDVEASFSTGSLDLKFDGTDDGNPAAYGFTSLSLADAKPGDVSIAALEVNNAGTVDFSYAMGTTVTPLAPDDQAGADALAAELDVTVVGVASAAACDAAAFTAPTDTAVATTALSGAAIASRALVSGDADVLCYRVVVGDDAPQDSGATATFEFTATQS